MKNKTILITGGAGFIGTHLCENLLKSGNKVICLDNLYTGSLDNISKFLSDKNFTFVKHDVIEPYDIKCDVIFNLACPASPVHYQKDPVKTLLTSVLGAKNALDNALKYDAVVLQASTSEVYGDPEIHPQPEEYKGNVNPDGIRACYDEGKRCAETLFFDYHRTYKVKIKVVRIFNTYGPFMRADDGRVVSNFVLQALNNEDITIYGDGNQTRSFCYVEDLINGLVRMSESDACITGPINLGNPNEFTMKQLADLVISETKSNSKIIYLPLPQDDPKLRKPVINMAKKQLGWEPKIMLKEGLKQTIEYFKGVIYEKN